MTCEAQQMMNSFNDLSKDHFFTYPTSLGSGFPTEQNYQRGDERSNK